MSKEIQLGLLGLGTVGSTFVQNLVKQTFCKNVVINKILLLNLDKKRDIDTSNYQLTTDAYEIISDPNIDIVVELIGGEQPALEYILACIKNRKIVITANKCVMALHAAEIISLAKEYKTPVLYEASVAGGIPIIRTILNSLQSIEITGFIGICNGTSNFIISSMFDKKISFEQALQQAQKLGYAEADPKLDVEGLDAAYKANILSSLCFKHYSDFSKIYVEGITQISILQLEQADRLGYRIKPVIFGKKIDNAIQVGVFLAVINKQNILANVNGVDNIVQINSDLLGQSSYIGPGAGGDPTTASVFSDLINVICNSNIDLNYYEQYTHEYSYINIDEICFRFFITLTIDVNERKVTISNFHDFKVDLANNIEKILHRNKIKANQIHFVEHDLEANYVNIIILSDYLKNNQIAEVCKNLNNIEHASSCNYIRILE